MTQTNRCYIGDARYTYNKPINFLGGNHMKKILSIMLALILVLSMATVAFAAETDTGDENSGSTTVWGGIYTPTAATSFEEIEKTYASENNVVVNETLSFTSTPVSTNPDTTNLTVDNLVVSTATPGKVKVNIPSLSKAGVYEWVITENAGNTAGVTYTTSEIHVIVLVEYDNVNHSLKIANTQSYIKAVSGVKEKTFNNTFKSGSFTVAKEVTGNMANQNDEFEITVTLTSTKPIGTDISVAGTTVDSTAWTESNGTYTYAYTTSYSQIGGAKAFADIPEGVTVSIVENDAKMNGYTYVSTNENKENSFSMTVADTDNKEVVVTNDKTTEVDMGITLDSLPYILMLVVVCAAMFVLFTKKRAAREN